MDGLAKRRFFIFIAIFIGVVVISVYVYIINQPTSPNIPDKAITIPENSIATSGVAIEGLVNLTRNGLSQKQVAELEANIKIFTEKLDDVKKLTVDISSAKDIFDTQKNYYIYSFTIQSDKGGVYSIDLIHASALDAHIYIYDGKKNLLYTSPSD